MGVYSTTIVTYTSISHLNVLFVKMSMGDVRSQNQIFPSSRHVSYSITIKQWYMINLNPGLSV